jgi:hypothetical protein
MAIRVDPTPNPNAMKFSVGRPVGGPGTYVAGSKAEEAFVEPILELEGVTSVFFTADFVTISKTPTGTWDAIIPAATAILGSHFSD